MQISIIDLKNYLRVESSEEDALIQGLIDGAISHSETILNRPILDKNMTAETTWEVPGSIRMAIYLLCSHWYENRTPIGQSTDEVAFTVNALLKPHKFYNI